MRKIFRAQSRPQEKTIHQMMGNLFSRRVSPAEIKEFDYSELKYWNNWHEVMKKEEEEFSKRMMGQ